MKQYNQLKDCVVTNKNVLVRVDINVPIVNGKIIDDTRLKAVIPTLEYLLKNGAKVIVVSHFGRPEGQKVESMSLKQLHLPLQNLLPQYKIGFFNDCVGEDARKAVSNTNYGELILLENLRFYSEETKNNQDFARELSSLANLYVNDAFSCSHRAHASIVGVAQYLKSSAGFLLANELDHLNNLFSNQEGRILAIVAGSKVSTKIELLKSLANKVATLVVGGAMANTFLYALGHNVGKSLYEPELADTALNIVELAKNNNCNLLLPQDLVVTSKIQMHKPCRIVNIADVAKDEIIADVGFNTVAEIANLLPLHQKVLWNGPLGAFETLPFNVGSESLARAIAYQTQQKNIISVAGGGDVVACLNNAGLFSQFSYVSTAGGAFLEWLEGKDLPGIVALSNNRK
jgi:phosphoglycerate kinase